MKRFPLGLVVITFSVFCGNLLIWNITVKFFPKVMLENHLIENIQVASLFLGFMCFSFVAYKSKAREFTLLFMGLSLLYLTFFTRELDLEGMGAEVGILSFVKSRGFLYGLAIAWAATSLMVLFKFAKTLTAFYDWVITTRGNLLVAAGLFYVLGDFFDKNTLGLSYQSSIYFEEFLEINATTLMLLSAFMHLALTKALNRQTKVAAGSHLRKPT